MIVEKTLHLYHNERTDKYEPLLEGINVHEGLVLRHSVTDNTIFLVHGHQGDLINDHLWWLGRLFVRGLWKHLQIIGVRDPTSPAKNFRKQVVVDRKITAWATANNQMLIAGHTHRPRFPDEGGPPYFNAGSCVHPRCITGIEIEKGEISLIKWWSTPKDDGALYVTREVLEGPKKVQSFFKGK